MNALATINKPSPVEAFKLEVLPPERARDVFRALPGHVKPERFERNLVNALMQNPTLLKCDPRLVYREVSKAAALGLLLDPQLGEAYLIVGWNGKAQREEPQLRVGYRGVMKLARQSGEIANIYAHEVCQNDEVECILGDSKKLHHKPTLFGERGPVVGYYAIVKFKDGETDFEPMTLDQIHEIRDRSDGWKAFKAGKIKSTPWSTDEGEMAKKTVIRRLVKRIPQSPELADAIRIEDAAEQVVDVVPSRAIPPSAPAAPQLTAQATEAYGITEIDAEIELTGHVLDGEEVLQADETTSTGANDDAAAVEQTADRGATQASVGAEDSGQSSPPAPSASSALNPVDQFIADCGAAKTEAALEKIRNRFTEKHKASTSDGDWNRCVDAFQAACERVAPTKRAAAKSQPAPQPTPVDNAGPAPDEVVAEAIDVIARCKSAEDVEMVYSEYDWEASVTHVDGYVEKLRAVKDEHLRRLAKPVEQKPEPKPTPVEGQGADSFGTVEEYSAHIRALVDGVQSADGAMSLAKFWRDTRAIRNDFDMSGEARRELQVLIEKKMAEFEV